MSNIVIDESRILQLEEDRVTLRNNLREQGIACKDDETLESLIAKVDDLQSWTKYLDKTISGVLYSNTVQNLTYSFESRNYLTAIILENVTSMTGYCFRDCSNIEKIIMKSLGSGNAMEWAKNCASLKLVILPNVTVLNTYAFDLSGIIEKAIFSRYSGNVLGTISSNKMILADFGNAQTMSGFSARGSANFDKLILRNDNTITTLSATSIFNNTPFATSGGKLFVPSTIISNYETATNWSALVGMTVLALEGSRFEDLDWWEDVYNQDGTAKNTCTLDGNLIETADNETVAIFKHTENISHCYENGVELQDTDLVKGKTLTSTI